MIMNKAYSEKGRKEHDRIFKKKNCWDEANVVDGAECPYEADGKYKPKIDSTSKVVFNCYEPISKDCCLCKKYPCVTVNGVSVKELETRNSKK